MEIKEKLLDILKTIDADAKVIKDSMLDIDVKMIQIQAKMNGIEENYRKLTLEIARMEGENYGRLTGED